MFKKSIIVLALAMLLTSLTYAHGPSRQKVMKTITINSSAESVWNIISDFCSIKDWNPKVTDCAITEGDNNQKGAIRTLTLDNGHKINEKLIKLDKKTYKIQFMLTEPNIDAFPINTHGSTLMLSKEGDNTKVTWKGAFYRSFPGPNPPPELSDAAGQKALSAYYMAGLEKLKSLAE